MTVPLSECVVELGWDAGLSDEEKADLAIWDRNTGGSKGGTEFVVNYRPGLDSLAWWYEDHDAHVRGVKVAARLDSEFPFEMMTEVRLKKDRKRVMARRAKNRRVLARKTTRRG